MKKSKALFDPGKAEIGPGGSITMNRDMAMAMSLACMGISSALIMFAEPIKEVEDRLGTQDATKAAVEQIGQKGVSLIILNIEILGGIASQVKKMDGQDDSFLFVLSGMETAFLRWLMQTTRSHSREYLELGTADCEEEELARQTRYWSGQLLLALDTMEDPDAD